METEKVALTVDEAADATGIGRTRLYEEIASGRLIARKVGRRTVITVEDLKAWLNDRQRFPRKQSRS